jgi:hypothetical protein
VQRVTLGDPHVVALAGQVLAAAVDPLEDLARAPAGQPAVDSPRIRQPAVVVDGDLARLQEAVDDLDAVAAAVQAPVEAVVELGDPVERGGCAAACRVLHAFGKLV